MLGYLEEKKIDMWNSFLLAPLLELIYLLHVPDAKEDIKSYLTSSFEVKLPNVVTLSS